MGVRGPDRPVACSGLVTSAHACTARLPSTQPRWLAFGWSAFSDDCAPALSCSDRAVNLGISKGREDGGSVKEKRARRGRGMERVAGGKVAP